MSRIWPFLTKEMLQKERAWVQAQATPGSQPNSVTCLVEWIHARLSSLSLSVLFIKRAVVWARHYIEWHLWMVGVNEWEPGDCHLTAIFRCIGQDFTSDSFFNNLIWGQGPKWQWKRKGSALNSLIYGQCVDWSKLNISNYLCSC